jgi:hypothetical protein
LSRPELWNRSTVTLPVLLSIAGNIHLIGVRRPSMC